MRGDGYEATGEPVDLSKVRVPPGPTPGGKPVVTDMAIGTDTSQPWPQVHLSPRVASVILSDGVTHRTFHDNTTGWAAVDMGPIERSVWVARLRGIADLLEATGSEEGDA